MGRQREIKSSENKIAVEVMCFCWKALVTGNGHTLFVQSFGGEL